MYKYKSTLSPEWNTGRKILSGCITLGLHGFWTVQFYQQNSTQASLSDDEDGASYFAVCSSCFLFWKQREFERSGKHKYLSIWKDWGGILFSPSSNALPFASCTTTLVNSSAHSNPSPPGRPGVKSVRCCLGSQQHGTSSCACDQVLEWEMGESCWFPSMTDHQAARQNLKVSNFNKCMSLKISVTFYVAVSHWLTIQG